jgi:hypothetical protein
LLPAYFYRRDFDPRATAAITLEEVLGAVLERLTSSLPALR